MNSPNICITVWAVEQLRDFGYKDSTIALLLKGYHPTIACLATDDTDDSWMERMFNRRLRRCR